jgi:type II secretory pathway component PulM
MRQIWEKLSKKEKIYLAAGLALAISILLVQLVFTPFFEEKSKVSHAIDNQKKILGDVTVLAAEYRELRQDMERMQRALSARAPDFTLYSYMEKKAREAGVRPNIKSMNQSKGAVAGSYEEAYVDVTLEKITLNQLVRLLYLAESPRGAISLKKLSVTKSPENPDYLTCRLQVMTYQSSREEKAPTASKVN